MSTFKPAQDVLDGIIDMASLLAHSGLSTAATAEYAGDTANFLAFMGTSPTAHYRQLAMLSEDDLKLYLPQWKPKGRAPTMGALAAVKVTWTTARCIMQFEEWPGTPPLPLLRRSLRLRLVKRC